MTLRSPGAPATAEPSAQHATFVIERKFDASPSHVFTAFSDQRVKARCFVGPDRWQSSDHRLDFRAGGREHLSSGLPGRPIHTFDAIYHDIVPDRRIVYSYEMHLDGRRISVSLATLELLPAGAGTDLVLAEQDAFLDSQDFASQREQGARELLDNPEAELRRASPTSNQ